MSQNEIIKFSGSFTNDCQVMINFLPIFANEMKHECVLPEHVLSMLLKHAYIRYLLNQCGVSINNILKKLESFLKNKVEKKKDSSICYFSPSVVRLLFNTQSLANESQYEPGLDFLFLAILKETKTDAYRFLSEEGVEYLKIKNLVIKFLKTVNKDLIHAFATENNSRSINNSKSPMANFHDFNFLKRELLTYANNSYDNSNEFNLDYDVKIFSNPFELDENDVEYLDSSDIFNTDVENIDDYVINLTQLQTEQNRIPFVGREKELQQILQTLIRFKKNNPLLVGEPGVGKTAIVEELVYLLKQPNISEQLKGTQIYQLNVGQLMAGTTLHGEFEERMQAIIQKLSQNNKNILFIDEIHTIVTPPNNGQGYIGASELLKPVLEKGEFRCIGITTYSEYRNSISKNSTFSRRFQKIDIVEPSQEDSLKILQGIIKQYESHYKVKYTSEACKSAIQLSASLISNHFLPDKAIDLIDATGARNQLSAKPHSTIDKKDIENKIAEILNMPFKAITQNENILLKKINIHLKKVIIGQDHAVEAVTHCVKIAQAGLHRKDKPMGTFLFCGPTGVGKTELAKQLAIELNIPFTRFDMSEYSEEHTVAKFIGSPPGYVGFDQGGLLTESIIKHPHAVLLLDEIEKAHSKVHNILLQIMDYGILSDNTGRQANFKNIILILTSNAGSASLSTSAIGFNTGRDDVYFKSQKAIEKQFSPEFRNRLDAIVQFNPLTLEQIIKIVDKFVGQINAQFFDRNLKISLSSDARLWIAKKGFDNKLGARPMERLIRSEITEKAIDEILFGSLQKGGEIQVSVENSSNTLKLNFISLKKNKMSFHFKKNHKTDIKNTMIKFNKD